MRWMRLLGWLVLVSGCDLLFTPGDHAVVDAAGDGATPDALRVDADPAAPMVTAISVPGPVFGGNVALVTVNLAGIADSTVHYQLTSIGGSFATPSGTTLLDVGGSGQIVLPWDAGSLPEHASITVEVSYESSFVPSNSVTKPFDVFQVVGNYGPLGGSEQLPGNELIAFRIHGGAFGNATLGLLAPSGSQALIGIYDTFGGGGMPDSLEVSGQVTVGGRTEVVSVPMAIPAGDHWLALLFDTTTQIEGLGASPPMLPISGGPVQFGDGLPSSFPASSTTSGEYSAYVIIAPP